VEVVELFLKACPEALSSQINAGDTPLHLACQHAAPMEVIKLLMEAGLERGCSLENILSRR
jgi:hypothetical protein